MFHNIWRNFTNYKTLWLLWRARFQRKQNQLLAADPLLATVTTKEMEVETQSLIAIWPDHSEEEGHSLEAGGMVRGWTGSSFWFSIKAVFLPQGR